MLRAFVYCSAAKFGDIITQRFDVEEDCPTWMAEPAGPWRFNEFGVKTNGARIRSGTAKLIRLQNVSVQRHSLDMMRYHVILSDGVCADESYHHGPWLGESFQIGVGNGAFNYGEGATINLMDDVPIGAVVHEPHVLISHMWQDNYAHALHETLSRFWCKDDWPMRAPLIWEAGGAAQKTMAKAWLRSLVVDMPAERTMYRELWLPTMRAPYCVSRAQVEFLRSELQHVGGGNGEIRRIYISRSDANSRRVTNEAALCQALEDRGFVAFTLGEMSLAGQARIFRGAETIVAPHGAGLVNMLFAERAKVIELAPETYRHPMFGLMAGWSGHDYRRILCPTKGGSNDMAADVGAVLAAVG